LLERGEAAAFGHFVAAADILWLSSSAALEGRSPWEILFRLSGASTGRSLRVGVGLQATVGVLSD
jgi:hypothetical protein